MYDEDNVIGDTGDINISDILSSYLYCILIDVIGGFFLSINVILMPVQQPIERI